MNAVSSSPSPQAITIITGGSQGIGKALALEFAQGGHNILLVSRNKQQLDKAASQIRQNTEVKILTLACNLAHVEDCAAIEDLLVQENFYCQNLINNAGFGLAGNFADHKEALIRDMIDLNIRALTDLSRRFLPDMLKRGEGGILNIASMGGLLPGPYQATYYASKAYVLSLTQALSWETWGTGVHVCALAPGPVRTKFHQTMGARSELYIKSGAGISARRAAHMGYSGFMCGKSLIIPGILSQLGVIALKIIPHDLLMPVMGWFLKARLMPDKINKHKE
jgi:short-subunit dehydrogenase